jgi:hypothetical protein
VEARCLPVIASSATLIGLRAAAAVRRPDDRRLRKICRQEWDPSEHTPEADQIKQTAFG